MSSGCSLSKASGSCVSGCRSTTSCHQTSRPGCQATSWPVRRTTSTVPTSGHSFTASSTIGLSALGAPHSLVFGGFSAEALAGRIIDADARFVITADGGYRRGAPNALKPIVDDAVKECPDVDTVLVVRRTGQDVAWHPGRDVWWHEVVDRQPETHEPEAFDSEHPLYILYTSGTTAKPKGIFHTSGGYLTQCAATHKYIFDHK